MCITITETHKYFPTWQQSFLIENLTKEAKIKELKPITTSINSLKMRSEIINQKQPVILIKDNVTLYFYNNEKITAEMIRYADDSFNNFAIAMASIFFFVTLIFVPIDYLGSLRYTSPEILNK
jgi:hypothetical protein